MATTKIHAIKSTVGKAIKYICNEQKTDHNVLISSYGCGVQSAEFDFKFLLGKNQSSGPNSEPNLAYHLIQSFAPGEVTGEEAHAISQELADRLLQGKYPYVLATHIDRNHVHSHLIFCSVNNQDYKKYHRCTQSYNQIRKLSDEICAEHGKSVIKETTRTGKTYAEWMHERKGDSWKAKIKKDIDECILISRSYEEFLQRMRDKGYEINGETFGEGSAKYISFRPYGKDRFVRGRAQSLGADYTKEKIWERIEERSSLGTDITKETFRNILGDSTSSSPRGSLAFGKEQEMVLNISGPVLTIEEYLKKHQTGSPTSLIDTSDEKFANSIGLSKWADKENFKRFAAMYAELGVQGFQSILELKDRIKELRLQAHQEKKNVISLERGIKEFGNIRSFAKQYLENKKYHITYQNSKDKERYYRMHFDQINMFDSASEWLKSSGINTATLNLGKIEEHYQKLIADKNHLSESYVAKEAECDRLKKIDDSFSKFLDNPSHDRTMPTKKKDRNILL